MGFSRRLVVSSSFALVACGEPRGENAFDAQGGADGGAQTSGSGATDGPSGDADDDDDDLAEDDGADDGIDDDAGDDSVFDVGAGDGLMPSDGCTKIDFLFVVDNSASMGSHQSALINSFGPFLDTIFATVQAQDYHIMVVDSDGGDDINGACEPCTPNSFWCGDWCTAKASLDVACETTLGAGEVAPYNNEASNTICGVPDGKRFLTSESSPAELESLFSCIGDVGIFGSGAELPMSAMVQALSGGGGCNDDFLRSDAILVVTFISDDYPVPNTPDNASTVGAPGEWFDAIVAAKGGNPDNVVMLGIMNTEDAACVRGAGDPVVHPTERFVELVDAFGERGLLGNICADNYGAFFEQAVGLIDVACDEYEPEG